MRGLSSGQPLPLVQGGNEHEVEKDRSVPQVLRGQTRSGEEEDSGRGSIELRS